MRDRFRVLIWLIRMSREAVACGSGNGEAIIDVCVDDVVGVNGDGSLVEHALDELGGIVGSDAVCDQRINYGLPMPLGIFAGGLKWCRASHGVQRAS